GERVGVEPRAARGRLGASGVAQRAERLREGPGREPGLAAQPLGRRAREACAPDAHREARRGGALLERREVGGERGGRAAVGSGRRGGGGARSRTRPPPSVVPPCAVRAKPRTTKRSPGSSGSGSPSTWSRAKRRVPRSSRGSPIGATRARRCAVPARSSTET